MKKTLAFVLLAAMLIGMLAGCGSGGTAQTTAAAENETKATLETSAMNVEATGTKGGNVTMGPDSQKKTMVAVASKSFETLDPFFASGAVAARQRTLLWDTLFDMEMGGNEEIGLCAKEWSFSEDGKTVYVEIYDNIHDSENNPINAHDFEWFYNKYLENKTLANLTSLVATGDYTLEIGLKYAYYPGYLHNATQAVVAMAEKAYDPDRFRSDPVTSGQYKAIDFTSGASATFMQTYNYWGDPSRLGKHRAANVDVCRFDVITENSQIETALSTNTIQTADITASIAEDFTKSGDVQVILTAESYPGVFMLNNAPGSVFEGNKALREAVAYAMDYTSMCIAATNGNGSVTGIMGNDSISGYSEDFAKYAYGYDPAKAQEKLAEAGYKSGELTLRYVTNASNSVGVIMEQCVAAVGIKLEIVLLDETQYLTTRQQANDLGWDLLFLQIVPKGFLTNMMVTMCDTNAYAFGSYCGAKDEELWALVDKARYSQSTEDVEAAYAALMDRLYYIPTWNDYGYAGAYSKIEGVVKDVSMELIAQASIFADDYDVYYEG